MSELLPCPLCGSAARLVECSRAHSFVPTVECMSCGCCASPAGPGSDNAIGVRSDDAVRHWNTRALARAKELEGLLREALPYCYDVCYDGDSEPIRIARDLRDRIDAALLGEK